MCWITHRLTFGALRLTPNAPLALRILVPATLERHALRKPATAFARRSKFKVLDEEAQEDAENE